MRRPAFQFYPADWRNSANLRRCSWEARGVWIEVMGLMHDSDVYGMLRWSLKEIAQALGAPLKLVQELAVKGVMKGCDAGVCQAFVYTPRSGRQDGQPVVLVDAQEGPLWYSSRMIKDEHLRRVRGEATQFADGPKQTPKIAPKGGLGEESSDGSSSSSSSSFSPSLCSGESARKAPKGSARFEGFWAAWPTSDRKAAKGKCLTEWTKARAEAHAEQIVAHVERLKRSADWTKEGGRYIPAPLVYLRERRWEGSDEQPSTANAWWVAAGFANAYEASNEGCRAHNAHQFRDGKLIKQAA